MLLFVVPDRWPFRKSDRCNTYKFSRVYGYGGQVRMQFSRAGYIGGMTEKGMKMSQVA